MTDTNQENMQDSSLDKDKLDTAKENSELNNEDQPIEGKLDTSLDGAPQLAKESSELNDKYLRAVAELQNLRTRSAREVLEAKWIGLIPFIQRLIEVIDNFDRALACDYKDVSSFKDGIDLIKKDITKTLHDNQITEINPKGEMFDPNFHESIAQESRDSVPPMTVIEVVRVGYSISNRLIRPALVKISC